MKKSLQKHALIIFFMVTGVFIQKVLAQDAFVVDSFLIAIDQADNDRNKIESLTGLSKYIQQFNLNDAVQYSAKALEIANDQKDILLRANAHLELGTLYIKIGNYIETFKHYEATERYFKELDLEAQSKAIKLYNNIGALHDRLEEYDLALEYYFRALGLINSGVDYPESYGFPAGLYNNIASIYERKDENKKAIDYYLKALESAEEKNDQANLGSIYNNLGKIYIKTGDHSLAKQQLWMSLKVRTSIDDRLGTAKSMYFLSNYYLDTSQEDSALFYAMQSHKLANELGHLETQCYSAMFLADAYDSLNNTASALKYHRLYKELSDSIISTEKVRELSNLRNKYELEELRKESMHTEQLLRVRYVAITGFLLLCITILILLFIVLRYKKNRIEHLKNQLEKDIEIKNRELTTNVMYLVKKNELINNVAKRLVQLLEQIRPENKNTIRQIIFDLNQEIDHDVWQDFEYRFNQVHNSFYDNLRKTFPELSPADRRLCAFLRLNLSTKEIAAITSQSAGSIDVARARLRKKLNLTNSDENLVDYLLLFD